MGVLAEVKLYDLVIKWVEEDGSVVRVEHERGEEDEALEELVEGDVVDSIVEALSRELKLPPSVAGRIKAKLKEVGLPMAAELRNMGVANVLEVKGKKGVFSLKITYSIA
ncbi:MAG: hypothetical protein TU35_006210 [Thermoproteus sp. AZ2]|jgi:hypothetical protein|uniref:Uncharacterized protein n=1 Tax=Thermoproteus sp. AZ2 TaxID=1609232 RepID=A0ACC6V1J0_9CREN|nr:MAG: hypothetical protein TU35_06710 [Thermoproteus sp. AZ2]